MAAKPPILPLVVLVVWLPAACGPADEPDPAAANASSDGASLDGATTDPDSSGATDTGASADSGPAVDAADTATPLPQCATADDCPAQNPCMIGSCTTKGTCAYAAKADASPCDDGNACTTADACAAGQCAGKGQLACDDENPCTADKCNPYAGCLNLPAAASSACDDGDACTQGDSCQAGQCEPGVNTCQCKTTSDCNKFEDGDQCNGTLYCDKAAGAPYTCKVNPASVVSCPSVNNSACQKNTCVPATGQCKLILSPENTPCDDGDSCTTGDF